MLTYYRIHRASEGLETLLDASRPDGWVASDEALETQPRGVSACIDLDALRSYIREYGMSVREGDRLVALTGHLGDPDRDAHAVRVIVESYEVIGDAMAWRRAGMPSEVAT